ncbi:hypothetical protein Fmac_019702 [Flemingia macrophylla]|uniref:Homeobox domain-containing protein n=1 Tax=Flemingia macrophylla TaxID=520843 RepID=A0ABD1M8K7_9FABA
MVMGKNDHSVSHWSPTKEQIGMLENMYKQGIRTPNANQIQQIATRLRAYGRIEGKNVFYWFQNHKARQRQKLKQKQQRIGYSNSVCSPNCLHQSLSGIGSCAQLGTGVCSRIQTFGMSRMCHRPQGYEQLQQDYNLSNSNHKVLTLFPLHPTGILKEKSTSQVPPLASFSNDVISQKNDDGPLGKPPLIDFFFQF